MGMKNARHLLKIAAIAFIFLSADLGRSAAIDFTNLGPLILQDVKKFSPTTPVDGFWGPIASHCKGATDNVSLQAKLCLEFATWPELQYAANKANLDNAATAIANAVFPLPPPPAPPAAADPLPATIGKFLDAAPGVDTNQVGGWTVYIAKACAAAATYDALRTSLINAFSTDPQLAWLNYDQNRIALDTAALNIANQQFPLPGMKPAAGGAATGVTNSNTVPLGTGSATLSKWRVTFSSGAEFLNPYFIVVPPGATKGYLTNAGSSTVAYLQFDVMRRWVLNPDFSKDSTGKWYDGFTFMNPTMKDWRPDFQFDLGFLIGNSSSSSNKSYSAQTLAGSDIYAGLSAGLPLWRNNWTNDGGIPVQVSLGGSIGLTTERSFEKIHANEFIGGLLDIGLPYGLFQTTNSVASGLVEARLGYGHLDFPSLTGTASQVNLDGNGIPIFREVWAPEMGINVLIPFGSSVFLNIEANGYFNDQSPDQWNVKVGATVPWTTVRTMISGLGL